MQSPRLPTHRLRLSARPAASDLPMMDHRDTETELLSYTSVLPNQLGVVFQIWIR